MIRKSIFWLHLVCGVAAGLVILMMSATGVVLTYERQIQLWEDGSYYTAPGAGESRLALDELIDSANADPSFTADSIVLSSDNAAPIAVRMGRSETKYLNPYTGSIYQPHSDAYSAFFSSVRSLHRWFLMTGENRTTARNITGASNLIFLFLVLSGIYLWLPKVINWTTLKIRLWFNPLAKAGAARDFNWHHVFGFWAMLPLLVIVSTATVFNYSWANNLVYTLAGDTPPVRGSASAAVDETTLPEIVNPLSLEQLISNASQYSDNWKTLTVSIPDATTPTATITIDEGNGGEPQKRHSLTLDRVTGATVEWAPFSSLPSGRQARSWVRFLHTGEALGLTGQTVAGLASLAAVFMVWTGLALAFRRFIRWRQRSKRALMANRESTAELNPQV
jgi:uncharacterized iron-regulated membrane protein